MAKTETTVRSYYYTVTSPNGGTVTDAEGKLKKTVDAGDQVTVQAPSDSLTCTDDDAVIYKANFNSPLLALRLLGQGGNALPSGYTRAEFLESTGSQYVNTGIVPNMDTGLRVEVSTEANVDYIPLGSRNDNSDSRISVVRRRVGALRQFSVGYGWGPWITLTSPQGELVKRTRYVGLTNWLCSRKVSFLGKTIGDSITKPLQVTELTWRYPLFMFASNTQGEAVLPLVGKLYNAGITVGQSLVGDYQPALDHTGTPCMFDLVTRKPFYNDGTGSFIVGLTLSQAAQLGRKLPSTGGTLTVSLPEGYDLEERVINSLAEAEAKGWVLTIQTYAAATEAATFALRRVWVRRVQDEHGSYIAADGSRRQVEWCVDIIGADPESLGYERFRSVDAAVAYWGLQPYVDPEAMDEAMGDNGTLEQGDTENTSPETNS